MLKVVLSFLGPLMSEVHGGMKSRAWYRNDNLSNRIYQVEVGAVYPAKSSLLFLLFNLTRKLLRGFAIALRPLKLWGVARARI